MPNAPALPKNLQRMLVRSIVLLFAVAAGVFGIQWWIGRKNDFDLGATDTRGMILALRSAEGRQAAAVIRADGSVLTAPGAPPNSTDRDATWNPSGNRVFFVSDRDGKAFHVYRWNPVEGREPERRTVDDSGRASVSFPIGDVPDADRSALIVSRGNVEEFIPGESRSVRVLPPQQRNIQSNDEGGGVGAFEAAYQRYGTSFRVARWMRGRDYVAAIMRREQGGEVLLIQTLLPDAQGALAPPFPVIAGERIEMDISPTGTLAFTTQVFDYPTEEAVREATKNNRVRKPFRHAIGIVTFENERPKIGIIAATKDDEQAFGRLAISPDGSKVIAAVGTYKDGVTPQGLVSFPAREGGGQGATPIVRGDADQPSFSKSGDRIVYVKRSGSERGVYVAAADGSGERAVSSGKGDFSEPRFSPQG